MNDFEFYKNRQSENYTLLRGVNDLPPFDIYCPIERNSYKISVLNPVDHL